MEAKVSAQELMDVVSDTNKKVTELSKKQHDRNVAGKLYSKFGSFIVLILSLMGVALSVSIFFPEILSMLKLSFTDFIWKIAYVVYAVITLFISAAMRIKTPLRVFAFIVAIAPMSIQIIQSVI